MLAGGDADDAGHLPSGPGASTVEFALNSGWLNVDGRVFFYDYRSESQFSNQCTNWDSDVAIVDESCAAEANERGTPFFEVTADEIKPAFTVPAAVSVAGIVRVR